jgi:O-antigen/teichoic acid export membrane protein
MAAPARRIGVSQQVARESGWRLVFRPTNTGLSFVSTMLLARLLGADAFAFALVTLLAIPAQSCLPSLFVRETDSGMAKGQPELVHGVWRWSGCMVEFISLMLVVFAIPLLLLWNRAVSSTQVLTLA